MGYFLAKTLLTAVIISAISELARRYTVWAAVLASLPITSILGHNGKNVGLIKSF